MGCRTVARFGSDSDTVGDACEDTAGCLGGHTVDSLRSDTAGGFDRCDPSGLGGHTFGNLWNVLVGGLGSVTIGSLGCVTIGGLGCVTIGGLGCVTIGGLVCVTIGGLAGALWVSRGVKAGIRTLVSCIAPNLSETLASFTVGGVGVVPGK